MGGGGCALSRMGHSAYPPAAALSCWREGLPVPGALEQITAVSLPCGHKDARLRSVIPRAGAEEELWQPKARLAPFPAPPALLSARAPGGQEQCAGLAASPPSQPLLSPGARPGLRLTPQGLASGCRGDSTGSPVEGLTHNPARGQGQLSFSLFCG